MTKQAEREATLLAFALMDHRRAQDNELNELRRVRDTLKAQMAYNEVWSEE